MEFKTAQKPITYGLSSPTPGDFGQGNMRLPAPTQAYTGNYPVADVFKSQGAPGGWPQPTVQQSLPFQQNAYMQPFNPQSVNPMPSPMQSSQFYPTLGPSPQVDNGWPVQTASNSFSNQGQVNGWPTPGLNNAYGQPNRDEYMPARSQARPPARLSPAEQTVKKLEQPLIRFLDENPQIREKIDGIDINEVTRDLTKSVGNQRVAIHNAYNQVPRFVDRSIIKQLDPQMQGYAQEFFEWVRKPPTGQELASAQRRKPSGSSSKTGFYEESVEKPAEKRSWNPFKRKQKAEPDLSTADLDRLMAEFSRNGY